MEAMGTCIVPFHSTLLRTCGKVNLSASGHELRFIRRVKFGDKARD